MTALLSTQIHFEKMRKKIFKKDTHKLFFFNFDLWVRIRSFPVNIYLSQRPKRASQLCVDSNVKSINGAIIWSVTQTFFVFLMHVTRISVELPLSYFNGSQYAFLSYRSLQTVKFPD